MALFIVPDECIACGDCEPDCPTGSITEKKNTFRAYALTGRRLLWLR
jgi:NAD-dependent dihydropyrimidine dehydrogenase PreA subunit